MLALNPYIAAGHDNLTLIVPKKMALQVIQS